MLPRASEPSLSSPRLACIVLPAFPLQVVLRTHTEWRDQPAVIVEADRPQAKVLWVNSNAFRAGVRTGMRYSAALSLVAELRAACDSPGQVRAAIAETVEALREFSPIIEASPVGEDPGVFWVKTAGLGWVYASSKDWAEQVLARMETLGYAGTVALGGNRFAVYALARERAYRGGKPVAICRNVAEERRRLEAIRLESLSLLPAVREELYRLGLERVGDLLKLPEDGLEKRYGAALIDLWRQAKGTRTLPLEAIPPPEPIGVWQALEPASSDSQLLLFLIKGMLPELLGQLAARYLVLTSLTIRFRYERAEFLGLDEVCELRPAAPTADEVVITDLVRLRLERLELRDEVSDVFLEARGAFTEKDQQDLLAERPKRDLDAANRALARLRADLGDERVVRLVLREAHLPEARFACEPVERLEPIPPPTLPAEKQLVRRILPKSRPLPGKELRERVAPVQYDGERPGPYHLSGGWWGRMDARATDRVYEYLETPEGEVLWVFYDRQKKRWYRQGWVE